MTNWAGKAILRRHAGQAKPPPPVRRSSSITASMNGALDRPPSQSQRVSKPPVLSPKPKLMSSSGDSRVNSRSSTSSVNSIASETFPSPPPPQVQLEDEGLLLVVVSASRMCTLHPPNNKRYIRVCQFSCALLAILRA